MFLVATFSSQMTYLQRVLSPFRVTSQVNLDDEGKIKKITSVLPILPLDPAMRFS